MELTLINIHLDKNADFRLTKGGTNFTYAERTYVRNCASIVSNTECDSSKINGIVEYTPGATLVEGDKFVIPLICHTIEKRAYVKGEKGFMLNSSSALEGWEIGNNFKYIVEDLLKIIGGDVNNPSIKSSSNDLKDTIVNTLRDNGYRDTKNIDIFHFDTPLQKQAYQYYLKNPGEFVSQAFKNRHANKSLPTLSEEICDSILADSILYTSLRENLREVHPFLLNKVRISPKDKYIFKLLVNLVIGVNKYDIYSKLSNLLGSSELSSYRVDLNSALRYLTDESSKENTTYKALLSKYEITSLEDFLESRVTYDDIRPAIDIVKNRSILGNTEIKCDII